MFHKGLLSEAVLALEAEVLKNPDNAEGWRLLGIAHAENDDDQQVILLLYSVHKLLAHFLEPYSLGSLHTVRLFELFRKCS